MCIYHIRNNMQKLTKIFITIYLLVKLCQVTHKNIVKQSPECAFLGLMNNKGWLNKNR